MPNKFGVRLEAGENIPKEELNDELLWHAWKVDLPSLRPRINQWMGDPHAAVIQGQARKFVKRARLLNEDQLDTLFGREANEKADNPETELRILSPWNKSAYPGYWVVASELALRRHTNVVECRSRTLKLPEEERTIFKIWEDASPVLVMFPFVEGLKELYHQLQEEEARKQALYHQLQEEEARKRAEKSKRARPRNLSALKRQASLNKRRQEEQDKQATARRQSQTQKNERKKDIRDVLDSLSKPTTQYTIKDIVSETSYSVDDLKLMLEIVHEQKAEFTKLNPGDVIKATVDLNTEILAAVIDELGTPKRVSEVAEQVEEMRAEQEKARKTSGGLLARAVSKFRRPRIGSRSRASARSNPGPREQPTKMRPKFHSAPPTDQYSRATPDEDDILSPPEQKSKQQLEKEWEMFISRKKEWKKSGKFKF